MKRRKQKVSTLARRPSRWAALGFVTACVLALMLSSLGTASASQLNGFYYAEVSDDGPIQEGRVGGFATYQAWAHDGRVSWRFLVDQDVAAAVGNPIVAQVSWLSVYGRSTQWHDSHFDERLNYGWHASLKSFKYASGWGPMAADHTVKAGTPIDVWFQATFKPKGGGFGVVSYHARILYQG